MSSEKFFTDVIKDVIGNEPVLDQFDTFYEASFYGTMQDDYITGSILKSTKIGTKTVLTEGLRGRYFSKFFSNSATQPEYAEGTAALLENPFLSSRITPGNEKVSRTAYRISQAFDKNERYYDSCLPDVNACLRVDSSEVWTLNRSKTQRFLSPYENFVTSSVGYLFFNYYTTSRDQEDLDFDSTTNNTWTWSYPYENKYSPNNRLLNFKKNMGVDFSSIEVDYVLSCSYPRALQNSVDLERFSKSHVPTSIIEKNRKPVERFVPLLPGFIDPSELPANARNSLRKFVTVTSGSQKHNIRFESSSSLGDTPDGGYCVMIPCDVDFSKKVSHDYLTSYSSLKLTKNLAAEFLTSSISSSDTIKFLFGFGDVNNLTYGDFVLDDSAISGSLTDFTVGKSTGKTESEWYKDLNNSNLIVSWSNAPSPYWSWKRQQKSGSANISSNNYYYLSSSTPGDDGLYWFPSSYTDQYALVSETYTGFSGNPGMLADDFSIASVDVTSSFPWHFSYERGVAADYLASLTVVFSGVPGVPTHQNSVDAYNMPTYNPLGSVIVLDSVVGTAVEVGSKAQGFMSKYDSKENGFLGANYSGLYNNEAKGYLFEPGEYRISFIFGSILHGILGSSPLQPYVAAIKNFKVTQLTSIKPDYKGKKIGGNNYPRYKKKIVDNRFDPAFLSSPYDENAIFSNASLVTGSSSIYESHILCVSPEIRGWKYGLYSGFPTNTRAIFRRDKFGQFRDMLEQRQYTKFVNVSFDSNDQVVDFDQENYLLKNNNFENLGPSVAEVNFVRQRYKKDERGIGYIYNEKVDPRLTISQNLSPEVTSSVPYFDGEAKLRQEEDLLLITDATLTSLQFGPNGLTVT